MEIQDSVFIIRCLSSIKNQGKIKNVKYCNKFLTTNH